MSQKALLILTDGFEEMETIIPIDLLRRAKVEVVTAGLKTEIVTGRQGVKIFADTLLDQTAGPFDALILPGGPGHKTLAESNLVLQTVQGCFRDGILCCAICAAAKVLSDAGILQGRNYTCYPGIQKDIANANYIDNKVVKDGQIITSQGPGTAISFALAIIAALAGQEKSAEIKNQIVYGD